MTTPSTLRLSGLASGVDTDSVVQLLMAIERQGQTRLKRDQSVSRMRQDALRDVNTRLKNLENRARELRSAGLWADVQTVESTDPGHVAVSRLGPSGPGGYRVEVERLARAEQRTYSYTPPAEDGSITIGGVGVPVAANMDIATLASSINSISGAPGYAAAVADPLSGEQRLVLSSRTPGAAGGFSASGAGVISEEPDRALAGLDAKILVDGVEHTASSNVIGDAIPGVQLTLKGVTTAPATVSVSSPGPDLEAVKAKIKAFVDQYNSTVDFISGKLNEERVKDPQTDSDAASGALRSDRSLDSLLGQLRRTVASFTAPDAPAGLRSLADLGISTGAAVGSGGLDQDAIHGKLKLDDNKLLDALASDPGAVRKVLGEALGDGGFARRLESIIHPSTEAGGELDSRIAREESARAAITTRLADMDQRLALKEERLRRQFAAMESALGKSQTQGQWLAGQLAALSRTRA
jgi:flagellar hook-associated protein 2